MAVLTFSVPYYSGIDLLAKTLTSVMGQERDDWAAVVCDDSDDPHVEPLVQQIGGGRIRYERNLPALGMAGNFNRCIDVAETDLVTVLHADDELLPNYTALMIESASRHPYAAALFCRAEIIGRESQPWFSLADVMKSRLDPSSQRETVIEGEPGLRALLVANFIVAPTLCFRRSVLGERRFPTTVHFVMDWDLTTSLVLDGDSLVGLPVYGYRYRRHDENATEHLTRSQLRFFEESAFYDRMAVRAAERGWTKCVRLAERKHMMKLNVAYRALKSAMSLQFTEARRGAALLWKL